MFIPFAKYHVFSVKLCSISSNLFAKVFALGKAVRINSSNLWLFLFPELPPNIQNPGKKLAMWFKFFKNLCR